MGNKEIKVAFYNIDKIMGQHEGDIQIKDLFNKFGLWNAKCLFFR